MPSDQSNLLPLSAIQHFLFCERQCALIHVEQAWAENRYTAEGRVLHNKAHDGPDESRPGVRITRGLPVVSHTLGLSGQCDVVEFHADGAIVPVEYKRGKPKAHRADEVQLCAQAMALEEMLGTAIPVGFLFYGKPRRRTEVLLDVGLRDLCRDLAARLHSMIASGITPPADYQPPKCDPCSLVEICQPKLSRKSASQWLARALSDGMPNDQ